MARPRTANTNVLKDALHNLSPEAATDPDYARGVLVGAMAALMHIKACTFTEAAVMIRPHLPQEITPAAVPDGWHHSLTRP